MVDGLCKCAPSEGEDGLKFKYITASSLWFKERPRASLVTNEEAVHIIVGNLDNHFEIPIKSDIASK